ncbi:hypothetical protein V2J09_016511 [Rumex salicifolius]
MTGSGKRRSSNWDLKEVILPENECDSVRPDKDGSLIENECTCTVPQKILKHDLQMQSRDHMSGAEGTKEKSNSRFEEDGHCATKKLAGLDGGKKQSRTHSSKIQGRASRSRSRSRSKNQSRSPARDPQRQPSLNDQSSRSGHSAPLCRDFSAGRCRKGDRCNFSHHGSLGRHLDKRVGIDRRSMHRDDKAKKSHSNSHSTERNATKINNDHLQCRSRRDVSCKFFHNDPGSSELRTGTVDGRHPDGSSYDQNELICTEEKSLDDWRPENKLNGMHEIPGDAKGSNGTSSASILKALDWDEDVIQEASTEIRYATELMRADAPGFSNFLYGATGMENNVSSCIDLSVSSDIPPGQSICVTAFPLNPMDGGVDSRLDDGTHMTNPDVSQIAHGPTLSQCSVLGGQLSQIPHLSTTTISHLLEKKEELPPLYAAIDVGSHISNSWAYVPPVDEATSLINQANKFTQHDPVCDSTETGMTTARKELLSSSVELGICVLGTPTVTDEICLSGDELGHQSYRAVSKEEEEEGKGTYEAREEAVDDKNVKGMKEMRPFKFALAEFVKELLTPAWKEGKLSKQVYKTIVKKVVDKVAGSIQDPHVPGTKDKIDQYMSFSKPKLIKLVQAYLERFKKNWS